MADEKKKALPFWFQVFCALCGLLGPVGLSLNLWDRFTQPSLEILEVIPVCLTPTNRTVLPGGTKLDGNLGMGAVVRVMPKHRAAFLEGVFITGKYHLALDEFLGWTNVNGQSLQHLNEERLRKKPYYKVSWSGSHKSGGAIKLEGYEPRYISILFSEAGWSEMQGVNEDFLGFDDGSKSPKDTLMLPDPYRVFDFRLLGDKRTFKATNVCADLRSGSLKFEIRSGLKVIPVSPDKLRSIRIVPYHRFLTEPPQKYLENPYFLP